MIQAAYGVEFVVTIPLRKLATPTAFVLSGDWTPAAGDVKVTKDGDMANAANIASLPTGHASIPGWKFTLSATEMQAKQILITIVDAVLVSDSILIQTIGHASAEIPYVTTDVVKAATSDLTTSVPSATAPLAEKLNFDVTLSMNGLDQGLQDAIGRDTSGTSKVTRTIGEAAGRLSYGKWASV